MYTRNESSNPSTVCSTRPLNRYLKQREIKEANKIVDVDRVQRKYVPGTIQFRACTFVPETSTDSTAIDYDGRNPVTANTRGVICWPGKCILEKNA